MCAYIWRGVEWSATAERRGAESRGGAGERERGGDLNVPHKPGKPDPES